MIERSRLVDRTCLHRIVAGIALMVGTLVTGSTAKAQPDNDTFSRREVLHGRRASTRGLITDATVQLEELSVTRPGPGEGSVWWEWTAVESGQVALRTEFSNGIWGLWGDTFPARMMLFEGTSLATLRLVAETKSGRELVAQVEGGHTYCFAIVGPNSANAFFAFNLSLAFPAHPVNDAPEARSQLIGDHLEANGSTIDATQDPGSVYPRVWWEWTAPRSGLAFIRMLNPSLQATFAVWPPESSGFPRDAPMNRALLWDDQAGEEEPLARYVWNVRQGETYLIAAVQELFTEPQDFAFQLMVSDFGLQADRTRAVRGETVSLTVDPPGFLAGIREVLLHSGEGLTRTNSGATFTFPWIPAGPGDFRTSACE